MYYVHIKDKVTDDPFPMYQNITELIEADGEAEAIFLEETVADQFPSRYFYTTDWKSNEQIELDITNYISKYTFDTFENCIYNLDDEFSYTKAHSFYMACLQHTGRNK